MTNKNGGGSGQGNSPFEGVGLDSKPVSMPITLDDGSVIRVYRRGGEYVVKVLYRVVIEG